MLLVSVRPDKNPELALDAKIIKETRVGLSSIVKKDELKVFHCKEVDALFKGLGPDHHVAFSINGAEFETYHYQARDDEGFIFHSNP